MAEPRCHPDSWGCHMMSPIGHMMSCDVIYYPHLNKLRKLRKDWYGDFCSMEQPAGINSPLFIYLWYSFSQAMSTPWAVVHQPLGFSVVKGWALMQFRLEGILLWVASFPQEEAEQIERCEMCPAIWAALPIEQTFGTMWRHGRNWKQRLFRKSSG